MCAIYFHGFYYCCCTALVSDDENMLKINKLQIYLACDRCGTSCIALQNKHTHTHIQLHAICVLPAHQHNHLLRLCPCVPPLTFSALLHEWGTDLAVMSSARLCVCACVSGRKEQAFPSLNSIALTLYYDTHVHVCVCLCDRASAARFLVHSDFIIFTISCSCAFFFFALDLYAYLLCTFLRIRATCIHTHTHTETLRCLLRSWHAFVILGLSGLLASKFICAALLHVWTCVNSYMLHVCVCTYALVWFM